MSEVDFERVGAILRQAADQFVCPRFRCLDDDAVSIKTHENDLVTIADLEAEVFLSGRLSDLLPGSLILGEEAVFQDPSTRRVLDTDDPVWIIDPIDGTANFTGGLPAFGIIVALVQHRRTVAGWIYDPLTRSMYSSAIGAGAWCDGRRLHMRPRAGRPLEELTGCITRRMAERKHHLVAGITQQGSAAQDYMALADGRLDFRLFKLLNPWDHAAGVLMVEEAGGYVRLLSGKPYAPIFHGADALLIAPDAETWDDVRIALEL